MCRTSQMIGPALSKSRVILQEKTLYPAKYAGSRQSGEWYNSDLPTHLLNEMKIHENRYFPTRERTVALANRDLVEYIIMGIILACGYLFLFYVISQNTANRKSVPLLAIILLIIYAMIAVPVMLILNQMGNSNFMLLSLLLLLSCMVLFAVVFMLISNFREINIRALVLLLLYLMVVAYVTLFSRSEGHSTAILLRFDSFSEALQKKSLEPLQHVFLNAIMFIPIGFLFSMIHDSFDSFFFVAPLGLMMSTLIEATQMFLTIGQCDVEDILANTMGTIVGLIIFRIYRLFFAKE